MFLKNYFLCSTSGDKISQKNLLDGFWILEVGENYILVLKQLGSRFNYISICTIKMGKGGKEANKNVDVAAPEDDSEDEEVSQNDVDESDFDDEDDFDEDMLLLKKI